MYDLKLRKRVVVMKKIICVLLAALMVFLVSCGKDESQKFLDEQEIKMNEAMAQTENTSEEEQDDVFVLRNSTGEDIYALEFTADGEETLLLENIVLPAGNEVKIKNSGEWEIRASFMDENGEYYYKSFGKCDLKSVIVLKKDGENCFTEAK